jgi:hypothetical protein
MDGKSANNDRFAEGLQQNEQCQAQPQYVLLRHDGYTARRQFLCSEMGEWAQNLLALTIQARQR